MSQQPCDRLQHRIAEEEEEDWRMTNFFLPDPFAVVPFPLWLEICKFLTLSDECAFAGCSASFAKWHHRLQSKRNKAILPKHLVVLNRDDEHDDHRHEIFHQSVFLRMELTTSIFSEQEEGSRTVIIPRLCRRPKSLQADSQLWTKDLTILVQDGHHFQNLTFLDMGSLASDEFMEKTSGCFPNLRDFRAVDSDRLSDTGLYSFVFQFRRLDFQLTGSDRTIQIEDEEDVDDLSGLQHLELEQQPQVPFPFRRDHLRYIDITYCKHTSYQTTLTLRQHFPHLIIRRQPAFMDGNFVTNFENDGIHTYWCDGTFRFQRQQCSRGYVMQVLQPHRSNPNHVQTKLQFTDFEAPPNWARLGLDLVYRPGVSLLNLERIENDAHDTAGNESQQPQDISLSRRDKSRTLLVAQCLRGLYSPKGWPKREHADLPVGKTFRFDRITGQIRNEQPGGDPNADDEASHRRDDIIVTRMQVLPLESLMPPDDVVQWNREFLEHRSAGEADLLYLNSERGRDLEQILHSRLI
jgi:hypothetical protein